MTRMIADRTFSYRGVRVMEGQPLDVDDEHVDLFKKIGHAHVDTEKKGYQTRVMTAVKGRRMKAKV